MQDGSLLANTSIPSSSADTTLAHDIQPQVPRKGILRSHSYGLDAAVPVRVSPRLSMHARTSLHSRLRRFPTFTSHLGQPNVSCLLGMLLLLRISAVNVTLFASEHFHSQAMALDQTDDAADEHHEDHRHEQIQLHQQLQQPQLHKISPTALPTGHLYPALDEVAQAVHVTPVNRPRPLVLYCAQVGAYLTTTDCSGRRRRLICAQSAAPWSTSLRPFLLTAVYVSVFAQVARVTRIFRNTIVCASSAPRAPGSCRQ